MIFESRKDIQCPIYIRIVNRYLISNLYIHIYIICIYIYIYIHSINIHMHTYIFAYEKIVFFYVNIHHPWNIHHRYKYHLCGTSIYNEYLYVATLWYIMNLICTGWWFGALFYILGMIIPIDFHIFQRGRAQPPTSDI